MKKKIIYWIAGLAPLPLLFIGIGMTDESIIMPVEKANYKSYDQNSFGAPRAGHKHRGVDIFAKKGTKINSATNGIVIFTGELSEGGKVVTVLSWRLKFYYYAHLNEILTTKGSIISQGDLIGTVGNTGNAKTTPAHLHFSISHFVPWKKYLDPVPILNATFK